LLEGQPVNESIQRALLAARGQNASVRSFGADNVFSDGAPYQMCAVTANAPTNGHEASLVVGIAA
jgi:hypothetical protein